MCMMLLRPGSLLEMCDSPRPRGLPSRCDLRAFNYIHGAAVNTLEAQGPHHPSCHCQARLRLLPNSALAAPRLCESLPVVCSSHASQVAQSPRLMEPPRALESSTARLCVPPVASFAKPIARAFDSSRTTVRACIRSAWSYRASSCRRPAAKPAAIPLLCFFPYTCVVTALDNPRPK